MTLSRFIGGILLIAGTSIGGGMLALPIANAAGGFLPSTIFLFICWTLMTCGAFLILEANLYLPAGTNMISMARATLGAPGLVTAWLSYLLLLYALLCAYISGGGDLLANVMTLLHVHLTSWQSIPMFTLLFGLIVYQGIQAVDWVNRGLMFAKLGAYILLVVFIAPRIEPVHLQGGHWQAMTGVIMILITSFGFAIIVPNLRVYFNDNIPVLRRVIWIGSCIPLLCYIAWDAVIMGVVPAQGVHGLTQLMQTARPASGLAESLEQIVQNPFINILFQFFSNICMLTAFLGVALCLTSFLADGLKTSQQGKSGVALFFLTFLPPLIIVLYFPGAYLQALQYAGMLCVILLLILPAAMVLSGRGRYHSTYRVSGGMILPILVIVCSFILLAQAVWMFIA